MTDDFSQYQYLIEQFKGKVNLPDFEAKYNAATENFAKSDKFLLKMELKRLASPCTRLIDLRGHVDGECKEHEIEGRRHFLDDTALRVYQDNIKRYGSYTFGVYDAVLNTENNFRVIYKKQQQSGGAPKPEEKPAAVAQPDKLNYPAKLVQFGRYFPRKEERMNYAISLQVQIANGEVFEAASSDLSVSGCKIRLKDAAEIELNAEVKIRFIGLEKEFEFGNLTEFTYLIKNSVSQDGDRFIGVERKFSGEPDSFMKFLAGYIQGNKRRYKINLENTCESIVTRGYEQFALPKSAELPVFLSKTEKGLKPKYALTSVNNNETYLYWQDERKKSTLSLLLNNSRLKRLNTLNENESLIVFCFKHRAKGKVFFYSADLLQLAEEDDSNVAKLLGFGANKETFKVFQLQLSAVDPTKCRAPLTIAESLDRKDSYLDLPPSDEVLQIVTPIKYMVTITDITSENAVSQYRVINYKDIDPSAIKTYGHNWILNPEMVDEVKINYKNQRQESRFVYKTKVLMGAKYGAKMVGASIDFSTLGLGVKLDEPCNLKKGDEVYVSFPDLQKITTKFDLKELPYEVMRVNEKKTTVNLRVVVKRHQHMGRAFFKLLIEKNHHKLTPDEYALLIPGLAKALRNIYGHFTRSINLFVKSSGSRYKFDTIGSTGNFGQLMKLMKDYSEVGDEFNLYPVLHNFKVYDYIVKQLKLMVTNDVSVAFDLYLRVQPTGDAIHEVFVSKVGDDVATKQHQDLFIRSAKKFGEFLCFKLVLSRTGTPDMEQLSPELNYIGAYAIHRAKKLEQDFWSVVGVAQVIDITEETMFRYKVSKTT